MSRNKLRTPAAKNSAASARLALVGKSVWPLAALGALLYWAALPPLGLWPLAWAAPVPWVLLLRRSDPLDRRAFAQLWLVGFLFWLAAVHWLRLPHPVTAIGWVALSVYLGCYLPLFVGLGRVARDRAGIPPWIAAPIVWMGLELLRAHLLTGFTMAAIEHTQLPFLSLIQLADITGQYGVGGVMFLVAGAVAMLVPIEKRSSWRPALAALLVLAAVLFYGRFRLGQEPSQANPAARIALIQGSIDVTIPPIENCDVLTQRQYGELSIRAAKEYGPLDLMVWPETVWPYPVYEFVENGEPPPYWTASPQEFEESKSRAVAESHAAIEDLALATDSPLLLGVGTYRLTAQGREQRLNSAQFVARDGRLLDRYDKMHLVLFGEYVPVLGWFPDYNFLATLCPETTRGDRPRCFEVGRTTVSPNICYESVIPHLIRRQVNTLRREGREPEVLVNLTNDGWFWGSSELDMHLACGVFRAIETRKPFLIAANTGFSAWIDGSGRILRQGPRRATGIIIADVVPDPRESFYLLYGEWLAGICLLVCAALGVVAPRSFAIGKCSCNEARTRRQSAPDSH